MKYLKRFESFYVNKIDSILFEYMNGFGLGYENMLRYCFELFSVNDKLYLELKYYPYMLEYYYWNTQDDIFALNRTALKDHIEYAVKDDVYLITHSNKDSDTYRLVDTIYKFLYNKYGDVNFQKEFAKERPNEIHYLLPFDIKEGVLENPISYDILKKYIDKKHSFFCYINRLSEKDITRFNSFEFQKEFLENNPSRYEDLIPFGYRDGIKELFPHIFSAHDLGL